jgi:hypothetical protein
MYVLYLLPMLGVTFIPIPNAHDVLALPHADRAPAHLRPLLAVLPRALLRRAPVELVAHDRKHEVLPNTVRDALSEADDPLPTSNVHRVLPDGPAHALVEEEIVRCRLEHRGRVDMRPEGPKGLYLRDILRVSNHLARRDEEIAHRGEGCDLLDPFLVIGNFVTWRALLAEPEDPSARADTVNMRSHIERDALRTYVFLSGWTGALPGVLSSATVVEKCFEDAIRGFCGGAGAGGLEAGSGAVVVVVVVVAFACDCRKREPE